MDLTSSFSPQKLEFIKAGGSYAVIFGKKLQNFASELLGTPMKAIFAHPKIVTNAKQGLTAVEKIFNKSALGVSSSSPLLAGSDVRIKVNVIGSQDTTGLMTSQELESMAATQISPNVDGAYQSGCHTASVWDFKAQENIPKLIEVYAKLWIDNCEGSK